jgi:predicted permease
MSNEAPTLRGSAWRRNGMRKLLELARRLAGSLRRSRSDTDLEEELRLHLSLAAEDAERRGVPADEAARLARARAGGIAQAMESLRDQRGLPRLDALRADAVFGWRQIARHRVASFAAVLSLALAMGATLAAFRLVDAVLLRPLPVSEPHRLFALTKTFIDNDRSVDDRDDFDYPTYRKYAALAAGEADLMLVGMAVRRPIVIGGGEPEAAVQQFVSGNVFSTLGIAPALGRLLGNNDDLVPDSHPVVVISHPYWQRRFAGDPSVIGRTFRMAGRLYEIVGVSEEGFTGTEPGAITDFFVPSMMNAEALERTGWTWFRIWLRPKAGVESARIQARLQASFHAEHVERVGLFAPDTPRWRIDAYLREQLLLRPAAAGVSGLQKIFRRPLWILAALAGLLLLIACVNVANLLLARAASRRTEMALRVSIGAGRGRLIQLMLMESVLLALLASAAGALFAWWSAPLVVSMLAPADRPVRLVLEVDWRMVTVAAALTLAVTALFGLAPALRASAAAPLDALREVRSQRAHRGVTDALVAAQMAFCVFLLFGAGLFVGTFHQLQTRPLGFASDNLLHLRVETTGTKPTEFWGQLAASLRDIPRVEAAAAASWAPLTGNRWRSAITVAGRQSPETAPHWVSVWEGYFETMRMPIIEGRDFRAGDRSPGTDEAKRPIAGVAIVNETFARVYFDGRSPVGQRVTVNSSGASMEIIGVTGDAVYFSVRESEQPTVFVPLEPRYGATLLVRTAGAAADMAQILRREIPRLAPGMTVYEVAPFDGFVTQQVIRERLLAALSVFFAALALVLAVIGLYGVLNYAVTRERREIGLRMALGARPGHVVTLITTRLLGMVGLGALVGVAGGLAFGRVVRTLLFQVEATDPAALALPLVALALAALLAVLPPAVRAVRIDPAQSIRTEG